jgi:hypothetical protein
MNFVIGYLLVGLIYSWINHSTIVQMSSRISDEGVRSRTVLISTFILTLSWPLLIVLAIIDLFR